MNNTATSREHDDHPDPTTGIDEAPAVDSNVSNAAGGAAAGAIAGTVVAGPVGTVIGAALGAIAGGIADLNGTEAIEPLQEGTYWRDHFVNRPYVEDGSSFDDYGPAFGYGVDAYTQYPGRSFDSIEVDLSQGWDAARGTSKLGWDRARSATRDAWQRVSLADGGAHANSAPVFTTPTEGQP